MTVAELIEILKTLPQDALVVQAKDAEGNNYSPTTNWIETGRYAAETSWNGQFGLFELTEEDQAQGYTEEDVPDGPVAVCLWPTN